MKTGPYLVLLFLLTSCATSVDKSFVWKDNFNKSYVNKPGEVIKVSFPAGYLDGEHVTCGKKKYIAYYNDGKIESYVPESYWSSMKPVKCFYHFKGKKRLVAKIKIVKKKFPSERLYVDRKRVTLSPKDQKRAAKEQLMLNKLYAASDDRPGFKDNFIAPLNSFITSIYGSRRVFNNKKRTQHLGTDFRAAIGTPIKSANDGKVMYADDLFYTGNTVIIDHGMGIFTVYGHLSKINVTAGEKVSQGDIIALAGNTGRTTGPHLHWGVKIAGQYIDGFSLINIDKK